MGGFSRSFNVTLWLVEQTELHQRSSTIITRQLKLLRNSAIIIFIVSPLPVYSSFLIWLVCAAV